MQALGNYVASSLNSLRTVSYYVSLRFAHQIFEKGISDVDHNQKDGYYRVLYFMKATDLRKCLADFQQSQERIDNDWFLKQLKDKETTIDFQDNIAVADDPEEAIVPLDFCDIVFYFLAILPPALPNIF